MYMYYPSLTLYVVICVIDHLLLLYCSGFTLALFVGFFFGSQFLPVEYMRLCDDEIHSCSGYCTIDYYIYRFVCDVYILGKCGICMWIYMG